MIPKYLRVLFALLLVHSGIVAVRAATNYQGQATQPISAASLPLPTGAATAAKQPALGTAGSASADVISVQGVASMTALKVDPSAVTSPVSAASLPLPAGASTAAKQPALGTAGSPSTDVITVQGNASGTPIPTTSQATTVSAPAITKVGATTSSAQLIASNATRKGMEIDTDCSNTDDVAINFGAGAAVYASHKILKPCTSWQAPPGLVITSAIQVISNTGTQQVRIVEYP